MSDSEDDLPLAARGVVPLVPKTERVEVKADAAKPRAETAAAPDVKPDVKQAAKSPAAAGAAAKIPKKPTAAAASKSPANGAKKGVAVKRPASAAPKAEAKVPKKSPASAKKRAREPASGSSSSSSSSSDSDSSSSDDSDDEPLSKRGGDKVTAKKPAARKATTPKDKAAKPKDKPAARATSGKKGQKMWDTLEHAGVLFPPMYEPHGVKLKYENKPVDLSPEEEEVASMFAAMKDTEYATKPVFLKNFWNDFREILSPANRKLLQSLELCDFTAIANYQLEIREKKKNMTKEEKVKIKEEKDKQEEPFLYATIDGRKERVGNFRVEPPGLFRGRGEHPKMGKLKKRIMPKDVIINIGEKAPTPPCPIPGHKWGEVIHNHTVTWLAGWKDSINVKDWKYVQFGAQSSIKGQSDLQKYEKARKLKDYVDAIRADYKRAWDSTDKKIQQMAVAVYLIDKLALRAGGEKDEDLADTVGCCTLRVGHVIHIEQTEATPCSIKFDFLGKDSIRYEQTHEVDPKVYDSMKRMKAGKGENDDLFDLIDPSTVNTHLQGLMEGLTIKVFRTYNASITLHNLLQETKEGTSLQKKAQYDAANKEVAILCNHQKGVSKAHDTQMAKMRDKTDAMEEELKALVKDKLNKEKNEKKIASLTERLEKAKLNMNMKEELKTVSLGTSKINYLDPRITIAWCKKWEMPINVVYTKALLEKFNWAMEVEPEFMF